MNWNVAPEKIESLRQSIRRIRTDIPLQQALAEDFPRDCSDLPISGGWGYAQEEAIVFVASEPSQAVPRDFVGLEYHIAQKIIYEELIIFRKEKDRFSGIDMKLRSQELISGNGKLYDRLDFIVSCWSDFHWEQLKTEWENSDNGQLHGFNLENHNAKRKAARIDYERQLWFDITRIHPS